MEKIKRIIKWKIDFLKKIDVSIGKWVMKMPILLFDFLIVAIFCISFLWGLIVIILQSFNLGLFIIIISFVIAIYLIFKRNKKTN